MPRKTLNLSQFTGSETFYRHPLFRLIFTEGVRYLADEAGAWWLIDAIFSHQADPKAKAEEFQFWKLVVDQSANSAVLTMEDGGKDGNRSKIIITQIIEYTDFPLDGIELYFANETLYLPSEH